MSGWGIGQIMKFTGMTKRDAWRTVKALNDQGLLATRKLTTRKNGVNRTFDAFAIVYSELEILTGSFRLVADGRACPPDSPRVPTENPARAHLTSRPCPRGHTNSNGNRSVKPKGTGERERLIVLVSSSGVFLATEAVERLAASCKEKALYDALMAIQPPTQDQLQHRQADGSKSDRESLIVRCRVQKMPPDEINRRLEAAGFDPVGISPSAAATITATKGRW